MNSTKLHTYIFNGKSLDGIIFDVDGTLWDSTASVAKAWQTAINENTTLNLKINAEVLSSLFGKTMDEIASALFPEKSEEECCWLMDLLFTYENRLLETEPGIFYPGLKETFEALSQAADLFIVSNCQCGYIEAFLKASGMEHLVKDFLCFGQTNTPKGQTIRTLMKNNYLENVIYVGDTQGDADACKDAAVPFVFASYGFGDVPDSAWKIQGLPDLVKMNEEK